MYAAVIISYLLHSVTGQLAAGPEHRPMILHCQMLQLRPHGLLLLRHHAVRSSLQKHEFVKNVNIISAGAGCYHQVIL